MHSIKGRLLYQVGNRGLLFEHLSFYDVNLEDGKRKLIAKLSIGKLTRFLCHFRLYARLKRLDPRCAGKLDDSRYVVCVLGKIWLVDIQKKRVDKLIETRSGFGLLNYCESNNCLYWGDYGINANYDEINIYRLDGNLNIRIVYTFPEGSIRHIHNIVKDGDGFVVMAGDNEPEAGIYHANADWTKVTPWKNGEQRYRAVVGFPCMRGFIYATDSVETENHIRLIDANGKESILTAINGSCIYGCETKDYFLFSTTVEPHEGGGKLSLIFEKLGGGIKSRDITIVAVRKEDLSVRQVTSFKKDGWPMKLFQYGRCIFACGGQNTNSVWCSPVACKNFDGKTIKIEL